MLISERLLLDYKQSMKEQDVIKKNTIQFLRAVILQNEKELGRHLTEDEAESVIAKERKKRLDTIAQADKIQALELKEQTQKELIFINNYLPQQLSEVDLTEEIRIIINDLGADSKMLGQVIATTKNKLGVRADGKMISDIAKQLLNI